LKQSNIIEKSFWFQVSLAKAVSKFHVSSFRFKVQGSKFKVQRFDDLDNLETQNGEALNEVKL